MATTKLFTIEDLEHLEPDEGRYELIRGELHHMSPTAFRHGVVSRRVAVPLANYVDAESLGEVVFNDPGFILAREPDTVLAPDIAFVRADRVPPEDAQDHFAELAPDLIVEVVSPSERRADIIRKIDAYLAAGVRLIWFVYPNRRGATVYRPGQPPLELDEHQVLDGGDVVPGFRLPLRDVFR